jgi:hypothetical protein
MAVGQAWECDDAAAGELASEHRLAVPLLRLELDANKAPFARLLDVQPLTNGRIGRFVALGHLKGHKNCNDWRSAWQSMEQPRLDVGQDPRGFSVGDDAGAVRHAELQEGQPEFEAQKGAESKKWRLGHLDVILGNGVHLHRKRGGKGECVGGQKLQRMGRCREITRARADTVNEADNVGSDARRIAHPGFGLGGFDGIGSILLSSDSPVQLQTAHKKSVMVGNEMQQRGHSRSIFIFLMSFSQLLGGCSFGLLSGRELSRRESESLFGVFVCFGGSSFRGGGSW